jgi:hypothetical protein
MEAVAREEIALEDVAETLIWVAGAEKADVFAYLLREREEARQERFDRIQALVMALELSQDEEEQARLAKELEELNRWPKHR